MIIINNKVSSKYYSKQYSNSIVKLSNYKGKAIYLNILKI